MKLSEALAIDQRKRDRLEQSNAERRRYVERVRETEADEDIRSYLGRLERRHA